MEPYQESSFESQGGEQDPSPDSAIVYPPKFVQTEEKGNVWVKSIISLGLYLVLGLYIFKRFDMLLLITAIVIIHELGHFFAMKFYRYGDLGIFFIPLLGAYVSGTKREVSQKESAVILLAGPLPGIAIGIIFHILYQYNPDLYISYISFEQIGLFFIFLNLINLLPVYPLDGGQLLNRVFLDEEGWMGKLFVILSAALMVWVAWQTDWKLWPLLIFPVMMLLRMQSDSKFNSVEKRMESEGVNADVSYEDLSDADYWKIRNILREEHPSFKDIPATPPYEFSPKEDKIMSTVQSLLHRHLIQDVSLGGKILILLICVIAFASPWIIKMDLSAFSFLLR